MGKKVKKVRENLVDNSVISLHSDRDSRNHIIRYINFKSLCYTLEMNVILYANYTSVNNVFKKCILCIFHRTLHTHARAHIESDICVEYVSKESK